MACDSRSICLIEEVQVGEDRADDKGVVGLEATLQRFA
jgi:hypothetical protein